MLNKVIVATKLADIKSRERGWRCPWTCPDGRLVASAVARGFAVAAVRAPRERRDAVPKRNGQSLYRVVHTLEDGRRLYLSTQGKLMVMPRAEAEFWTQLARKVHTITWDELVYSKDLLSYDHRSHFLENLRPFVRVVRTEVESTDVVLDPRAFVIGGALASTVAHHVRAQHDYNDTIVIIC